MLRSYCEPTSYWKIKDRLEKEGRKRGKGTGGHGKAREGAGGQKKGEERSGQEGTGG